MLSVYVLIFWMIIDETDNKNLDNNKAKDNLKNEYNPKMKTTPNYL